MKRISILPLFGALALAFYACGDGKQETYYDNDQVKERWSEAKGPDGQMVKNGVFEAFDEKGQKRDSVNYVMGKREGLELRWGPDGKIMTSSNWLDHQLDGRFTEFGPNGKPMSIATYKKGVLHGVQQVFNKAGVKTEETFYKNGLKDSVYQRWDDNGVLKQITHYLNGKSHGHEKIWCDQDDRSEVVREERDYVNGLREGLETYYLCLDGKISSTLYLKNDKMDGPYTHWDEGKKIVEIYKEGKCIKNCPKPPPPPPEE